MLKTIAYETIVISADRQRREFLPEPLNEMVESIQKFGLFHPVVLRKVGEDFVLVSGERRLRAMQDIWALDGVLRCDEQTIAKGFVPYVTLGDLSPIEAAEAELEENIRRISLTWQEHVTAVSKLSALRTAQAVAKGLPPPAVADISVEVRGSAEGYHQEATRREILVARHLGDPEVAGAKNLKEAFTALKRKESSDRSRDLAATVGRAFTSNSHAALNEDSLDWLTSVAAEQFDVILTDPPYGMGADEFGDAGGRTPGEHGYKDDAESFTRILSICQTELFRIAKPEAHLYWFCDIDQFHVAREAFSAAGWWVHRTPIIWHKPAGPRLPWPENGPQRKYELILYAVKGKKKTLKIAPDLITYPADANLGHSAQKPVALFADLLARSVRPGDRVLDPFAGSGPLVVAAHNAKCYATVLEKDPAAYGLILQRLKALDNQQELPI